MGKKLNRSHPKKIRTPTATATSWTKVKNLFLFLGAGVYPSLVGAQHTLQGLALTTGQQQAQRSCRQLGPMCSLTS